MKWSNHPIKKPNFVDEIFSKWMYKANSVANRLLIEMEMYNPKISVIQDPDDPTRLYIEVVIA